MNRYRESIFEKKEPLLIVNNWEKTTGLYKSNFTLQWL